MQKHVIGKTTTVPVPSLTEIGMGTLQSIDLGESDTIALAIELGADRLWIE
jgi:hypothetical protein